MHNMTQTPDQKLSNNTLALIALSNEFCHAIEGSASMERELFMQSMLRLLPRLYIAAGDIRPDQTDSDAPGDYLDEDTYNSLRRDIEAVMGEDDKYLDVVEEDMRYSDTPVTASIAEGCADLYQVFYNYIETVRDAPDMFIESVTAGLREDYEMYWSKVLCNVLRAVNAVLYR